MQCSSKNTGEYKGGIFFPFFFLFLPRLPPPPNISVQQAAEWLLCWNILILGFSGFKLTKLTWGCLKAQIKKKIWVAFHVVYADIWKDRATGSAHQGDREHLTLKINKIPAELCSHLIHMHDKLLALSFSFHLECWWGFVLFFGCGLLVWFFFPQLVKPSFRLKFHNFAVWYV